jgi:glycosyltransferase involved in cell wall biosynthesis
MVFAVLQWLWSETEGIVLIMDGSKRVCFDAYELAPGSGKSIGIYNYAISLVRAWAELADRKSELVVVCTRPFYEACSDISDRVEFDIVSDVRPTISQRQAWHFYRAANRVRKMQADVYFSPKGFLPRFVRSLARSKTVVVGHDLIPFWYRDNFPGTFGRIEEFVVCNRLKWSILKSDAVVAISKATAEDISRRFGRKCGVSIVSNGVPTVEPAEKVLAEDYIFSVTSSLPHKNSASLLAAYRKYREDTPRPLPLVVCGLDSVDAEGVTCVKGISDARLHSLYRHARFFVFLSRVEGFGFPPAEALLHGTPVLCSDLDVLKESTANGAVYVAPCDVGAISGKMIELSGERRRVDASVQARVECFSWERCAKGIESIVAAI